MVPFDRGSSEAIKENSSRKEVYRDISRTVEQEILPTEIFSASRSSHAKPTSSHRNVLIEENPLAYHRISPFCVSSHIAEEAEDSPYQKSVKNVVFRQTRNIIEPSMSPPRVKSRNPSHLTSTQYSCINHGPSFEPLAHFSSQVEPSRRVNSEERRMRKTSSHKNQNIRDSDINLNELLFSGVDMSSKRDKSSGLESLASEEASMSSVSSMEMVVATQEVSDTQIIDPLESSQSSKSVSREERRIRRDMNRQKSQIPHPKDRVTSVRSQSEIPRITQIQSPHLSILPET